MSTIDALLADLRARGINISVLNGKLHYAAPKGVLRPVDIERIRTHRDAIVGLLAPHRAARRPPLEPQPRSGAVPLSFAQERLWFLAQLATSSDAALYNMHALVALEGGIDVDVLEASLIELCRRHEILRTHFELHDSRAIQVVDATSSAFLYRFDLTHLPEEARKTQLQAIVQAEAQFPFDLTRAPLFRACTIRLETARHALMLSMHHIVSDAWSMAVIKRELNALYSAFMAGRPSPLPPLRIQYADYAIWQRRSLDGPELSTQLGYWREALAGAPPELILPWDRARPSMRSARGATKSFDVPSETAQALIELARMHDVTLNMMLLATYAVLLFRWSGHTDLVIGLPVTGRNETASESLIGFFVNMLPIRVQLSEAMTFLELLRYVRHRVLDAYSHQDVPFEKIVADLHPERNLSRQPIVQVAFQFMKFPQLDRDASVIANEALEAEAGGVAKFDLVLHVSESDDGISAAFEYATDLFREESIEALARMMTSLLNELAGAADTCISDLTIMSPAEAHRVTHLFNATARPLPGTCVVHRLFERQVQLTPEAIALVSDADTLTYRELNRRADKYAAYLAQTMSVSPGDRVALLLPRCAELVIAELAVLKCGASYVPIDPEHPRERQEFMLRDSGAHVVLASGLSAEAVGQVPVVYLETLRSSSESSRQELQVRSTGRDAAYVMYTSGSTGQPKGVVVPHEGIVRLVINNHFVSISPSDCIAFCSNPAFDPSTFEVWGALLNGARVLIVSQRMLLDPIALRDYLRNAGTTILHLTTGLFNQYAEALAPVFSEVECLLFGGEAADTKVVRRILRDSRPKRFVHLYGPTETTAFATSYTVDGVADDLERLPIGRPIANTQVYILDGRERPVPIGVPGELYIGGPGVAIGYLNRPELTTARFVADRFRSDQGGRLYRTGDWGRYRVDGTIEFLGRKDSQFKVRGFRVELAEIEAALITDTFVEQCLVQARDDDAGGKQLVAYLVPSPLAKAVEQGESVDRNESPEVAELPGKETLDRPLSGRARWLAMLRSALARRLPEYMVPSRVVVLEAFPLTPNGKIDRDALPAPDRNPNVSTGYLAPETEFEVAVSELWQELLRVDRVGRHHNFFELGGHSLLGVQMLARLRQRFGCALAIETLFEEQTVARFAAALELTVQAARLARPSSGKTAAPRQVGRI